MAFLIILKFTLLILDVLEYLEKISMEGNPNNLTKIVIIIYY